MADSQIDRLIGQRRKRLVATILGHAERELYAQLTKEQQVEFREKVLRAVDDFADLTRDILKVISEDVVVNQHALELLEALHRDVRELKA